MKIHILYNFTEGPWGGGNQFLKALRNQWEKEEIYTENPEEADVIIFNSFPFRAEYLFRAVRNIKKKYPKKLVIYRVDGPISTIRGTDKDVDKTITRFNKLFADGSIFISDWCKKENRKLFHLNPKRSISVLNAPNSGIFNQDNKKELNVERPKIIASSWSAGRNKGFATYKYLDENLDFNKYEMTFVGNSPVTFKNIKHIQPQPSEKLAKILKAHDIYITASENDPSSNALAEALACGLPVAALNDGGHPELIKKGGELFENKQQAMRAIDKIARNYKHYQNNIPDFSIRDATKQYYNFIYKIYQDTRAGKYIPKNAEGLQKTLSFYLIEASVFKRKVTGKTKSILKKLL